MSSELHTRNSTFTPATPFHLQDTCRKALGLLLALVSNRSEQVNKWGELGIEDHMKDNIKNIRGRGGWWKAGRDGWEGRREGRGGGRGGVA